MRVGWVAFRCACGFRLDGVPREVVEQLPRCLGCGRSLRKTSERVRAPFTLDVRDLR